MLDKFKSLFKKEEQPEPEDNDKQLKMEILKKKVLEHFHKIKPEVKEEKNHLSYNLEASDPTEYTEEHGQDLKKFLHKPSVDKMNGMKEEGKWRHLNKIFANNYEQE